MADQPPAKDPSPRSGEDFVGKYGKRLVVIVFSILVGDALPTIIERGADPDETFYMIVSVTMPYTASLVIIFLVLVKTKDKQPHEMLGISAFVAMLMFGLAAWVHWGITDSEVAGVTQEMARFAHVPPGSPKKNPLQVAANDIAVLVKFYYVKYGLALFVSATLAAVVVTWNIVKWYDGRKTGR